VAVKQVFLYSDTLQIIYTVNAIFDISIDSLC
jgi:hypothetical protein